MTTRQQLTFGHSCPQLKSLALTNPMMVLEVRLRRVQGHFGVCLHSSFTKLCVTWWHSHAFCSLITDVRFYETRSNLVCHQELLQAVGVIDRCNVETIHKWLVFLRREEAGLGERPLVKHGVCTGQGADEVRKTRGAAEIRKRVGARYGARVGRGMGAKIGAGMGYILQGRVTGLWGNVRGEMGR